MLSKLKPFKGNIDKCLSTFFTKSLSLTRVIEVSYVSSSDTKVLRPLTSNITRGRPYIRPILVTVLHLVNIYRTYNSALKHTKLETTSILHIPK